jgi:hypothetical protein
MTEVRVPQAWYAGVRAYRASLRSYLDHYRAMDDPKLEAMPLEGPEYAKLSSSLFTGCDHMHILKEARRLVEIITGAAKIKEAPGNLTIEYVVAIYADGETQKFTDLRLGSGRPYSYAKEEGSIKETFEKSVVLFALRCADRYPRVSEVLRTLAQSDDWLGLCRVFEIIRDDLNENDPKRKRDGYAKVVQRSWVAEAEMDSFKTTVKSYRHPEEDPVRTMSLVDAQNFIGRIIEGWIREVARRPQRPDGP